MLWQIPFLVSGILVVIGLYICIMKTNMVKIVMGVVLMGSGVNLFLVSLGYRENGTAPIFYQHPGGGMVMPTTQALTLTSIVIGVATTALLLAFVVMLYKRYGTVDTRKARRLRG